MLKYGALPLTFDAGSVEDGLRHPRRRPAAGRSDRRRHRLLLVVLYSLLYYRGLGLVAVASLLVAGVLTYGLVVLLGRRSASR